MLGGGAGFGPGDGGTATPPPPGPDAGRPGSVRGEEPGGPGMWPRSSRPVPARHVQRRPTPARAGGRVGPTSWNRGGNQPMPSGRGWLRPSHPWRATPTRRSRRSLMACFPRTIDVPPLRRRASRRRPSWCPFSLSRLRHNAALSCSPDVMRVPRTTRTSCCSVLRRIVAKRRAGVIELRDLPADCWTTSRHGALTTGITGVRRHESRHCWTRRGTRWRQPAACACPSATHLPRDPPTRDGAAQRRAAPARGADP